MRPTVRANPPPNLLYDLKASARAERWQRRAKIMYQAACVYVLVGATAGLVALVLLVMRR